MTIGMRNLVNGVSALAMLAAGTCAAYAGGFALREQSTYYQGMSFAGAASANGDKSSASSMYWNPATITEFSGRRFEAHVAGILPNSTIDVDRAVTPFLNPTFGLSAMAVPVAGDRDSGNIGDFAALPSTYTVLQITDDLFFANAVNGPFGLTNDADKDYQGRFHGTFSELRTYDINPALAYRFNDFISVGIGAQIVYADASLENAQIVPVAGALPGTLSALGSGHADLEGHGWGFGATAGVTIKPTDRTTIGLGFRSAVQITLRGDVQLDSFSQINPLLPVPANSKRNIQASFTLPEIVTFSLTHNLTERITLLGTLEWTNWSRFDELKIEDKSNNTLTLVEENWDDGWFFAVGGEFEATDRLTVRAGAAYELTPVPDEFRTPRIPDEDRIWLSLGASFQATERIALDFAYTHIFVEDGSINRAHANDFVRDGGLLVATAEDQSVDIVSLSARIKLGGDPIFRSSN